MSSEETADRVDPVGVRPGEVPDPQVAEKAVRRTFTAKYSASDQTALASRPNNILQWEAIKHGLASGLDVFDFGRTDIAQTGLRDFKLSWGCREELLLYSTIGRDREASASGALSSALGAVIRHSPAGFCKLVGNALYRYAA